MDRLLIIAAAGTGSRLSSTVPKILYPIAGQPILHRLMAMYARLVDRAVVVLSPDVEPLVRRHGAAARFDIAVQAAPTGMLDGVLAAHPIVARARPRFVWIAWCDQLALASTTLEALARRTGPDATADAVFPTLWRTSPYIHWVRNEDGSIAGVRQRREGDALPERGESDVGIFAVRGATYLDDLPAYGLEAPPGARTGERNFLPFIPWLTGRGGRVETFFASSDIEAVGVNTPEEAALVESYLTCRSSRS